VNGPLTAPASAAAGGNGVFAYGAAGAFPGNSFNATNYWVDVVFESTGGDTARRATAGEEPAGDAVAPADQPSATATAAGPAGACPCTLFGSTAPESDDAGADAPVVIGVRFTAAVDGFITAIRYYKSAANTGAHVAHLWAPDGTLLASAPFVRETASGWQEVALRTPVAVRTGLTYTASYSAPKGHYSFTAGGLATAHVQGALRTANDGEAGVFRYGTAVMPTSSFQEGNYWVDVVFVPREPSTSASLVRPGAGTLISAPWD